jgi:hypothetical protein
VAASYPSPVLDTGKAVFMELKSSAVGELRGYPRVVVVSDGTDSYLSPGGMAIFDTGKAVLMELGPSPVGELREYPSDVVLCIFRPTGLFGHCWNGVCTPVKAATGEHKQMRTRALLNMVFVKNLYGSCKCLKK